MRKKTETDMTEEKPEEGMTAECAADEAPDLSEELPLDETFRACEKQIARMVRLSAAMFCDEKRLADTPLPQLSQAVDRVVGLWQPWLQAREAADAGGVVLIPQVLAECESLLGEQKDPTEEGSPAEE